MELELKIKKPKFWQTKWKIRKPTLYLIEISRSGVWVNTYWWGGNWKDASFWFNGPIEVATRLSLERHKKPGTNFLVIGTSGTDLLIDKTRKVNGIRSGEGWTCFGSFDLEGKFTVDVREFNLVKEIEKSYR